MQSDNRFIASKVSIIVPMFNGKAYLIPFLNSLLSQTYSYFELIIIDDGSTDGSNKIVESYIDQFYQRGIKIIYIYKENGGAASAINLGFSNMSDDTNYVMWVDCDDILLPDNLERKILFMDMHLDYDAVLCDVITKYNDNETVQTWKKAFKYSLFRNILYANNIPDGFGGGCILVRKAFLKQAIPTMHIYESREGQNWQLMLPITWCGEIAYIDEPLFKYIRHTDSHSGMKRSYYSVLNRLHEFAVICIETINSIPSMNKIEKSYWKNCIYMHYLILRFRSRLKHFIQKRFPL